MLEFAVSDVQDESEGWGRMRWFQPAREEGRDRSQIEGQGFGVREQEVEEEMRKTDIYDFIKLAMQDHEFSLQPWQEEFVKSLGQPKRQFIYRSARGFHDELMWQIQLEVFRTFWLDGKSTVMFTPRFCDVRRPVVIIDEIWQLREVFAKHDELWYQENYLNRWVEPNDDTPISGGRDEH